MFNEAFDRFLEAQRQTAHGQRREMLERDLTGTRKLLEVVVWPVLKTLEGLLLENEMVSMSGVRIYADVYCQRLNAIIEHEGFAVHAENITRDRFAFEQMRIRTFAMYGYRFIPFSWDELDKKPDFCKRTLFELVGRFGGSEEEAGFMALSVQERELLRYAMSLNRPLRIADVSLCLRLGDNASRKVLRKLLERSLLKPLGTGNTRHHRYELDREAIFDLIKS